jgi:hypothetical protein
MSFEYADKVNHFLKKLDFVGALEVAEDGLCGQHQSPFHSILGRTFTNSLESFSTWIAEFIEDCPAEIEPAAIYFEMNEFDIYTDLWYISACLFSKDRIGSSDLDWLGDFNLSTEDKIYILTGFEDIQIAFEDFCGTEHHVALDWCEQIVICRFMEFVRSTHLYGAINGLRWSKTKVYFRKQENDFVLMSEVVES